MIKRVHKYAIVLLLLLVGSVAHALVVEDGDIRLTLHEDSARFTLEYRDGSGWAPFFFSDDPRTSSLDILEGNQVHRMGDSGTFSQSVEETGSGATYVFESPTLRIEQSFRFARGTTASVSNAVEMRVTVTNLGEAPQVSGVRLVYDTYLGEPSNFHFASSSGIQINRESLVDPGPVNRFVRSVARADSGNGFQVMISGEGVTTPEAVVLANWQRLAESSWEFQVNPTRNFNRLPYSINDSALLLTYPTVQLEQNQSATFVSYIGDLADSGYLIPAATPTAIAADSQIDRDDLVAELAAILSRIEELSSSATISAEDIDGLRERLAILREQLR